MSDEGIGVILALNLKRQYAGFPGAAACALNSYSDRRRGQRRGKPRSLNDKWPGNHAPFTHILKGHPVCLTTRRSAVGVLPTGIRQRSTDGNFVIRFGRR